MLSRKTPYGWERSSNIAWVVGLKPQKRWQGHRTPKRPPQKGAATSLSAAFFAFGIMRGVGGAGGEFAAFLGGPVGFGGLAAAGDAECVGGNVFGDYGAGGDV